MSASAADVGRKVICADGWRVTMHVEVRRGPSQGPDSERQGSTNRMSAAMFSGSPHSTRATTPDRTERQVTSEAADEATVTRRLARSARSQLGSLSVVNHELEGAAWVPRGAVGSNRRSGQKIMNRGDLPMRISNFTKDSGARTAGVARLTD
jgi:hypothetical protein